MDCGARHGNPQTKELQILPPLGGLNKLLLYYVPTSTQTQRSGLVQGLFLHTHYKHAKDGTGIHWLSSKSPQNSEDVGAIGVGALKESRGGGGWGWVFNYSDLSRHRKGKLNTHKRKLQDFLNL